MKLPLAQFGLATLPFVVAGAAHAVPDLTALALVSSTVVGLVGIGSLAALVAWWRWAVQRHPLATFGPIWKLRSVAMALPAIERNEILMCGSMTRRDWNELQKRLKAASHNDLGAMTTGRIHGLMDTLETGDIQRRK